MDVFDDLQKLQANYSNCVATIGKYDGIHRGHQLILNKVKQRAAELELPSLVILSEPQPEEFFNADQAPARLFSFADKVYFLKKQGLDLVYKMHFDKALSELSAEVFVEKVLHQGLGVKALVIGDDFRFGKNRAGDFSLLEKMGEALGFSVEATPSCVIDGQRVSSSLLREKLQAGDCEAVELLLGRPYQLRGEVVKGQQLGRKLGFPTANIEVAMKRLAIEGVFVANAEFEGRSIQGVASVGYKPSIAGKHGLAIEIFLLNFDENLYGKRLTVSFLKKIRQQEKFADLDALKTKMHEDLDVVLDFFNREAKLAKHP
jgi:riboflavin kinase/FMN adenylyltransferase